VIGVPAITYRASINETYDFGFYRLPNLISLPCFNLDELKAMLDKILSGEIGSANGDDRKVLIEQYLAARQGPLACERMVDVLETLVQDRRKMPKSGIGARIYGRSLYAVRTMIKRYKDSRPTSHNKPEFQRHRYPELSLSDMNERVSRFQQLLGSSKELKVERFFDQFFRISP
jgi:hypothetical protein